MDITIEYDTGDIVYHLEFDNKSRVYHVSYTEGDNIKLIGDVCLNDKLDSGDNIEELISKVYDLVTSYFRENIDSAELFKLLERKEQE